LQTPLVVSHVTVPIGGAGQSESLVQVGVQTSPIPPFTHLQPSEPAGHLPVQSASDAQVVGPIIMPLPELPGPIMPLPELPGPIMPLLELGEPVVPLPELPVVVGVPVDEAPPEPPLPDSTPGSPQPEPPRTVAAPSAARKTALINRFREKTVRMISP
jgi:hypothetical protein